MYDMNEEQCVFNRNKPNKCIALHIKECRGCKFFKSKYEYYIEKGTRYVKQYDDIKED